MQSMQKYTKYFVAKLFATSSGWNEICLITFVSASIYINIRSMYVCIVQYRSRFSHNSFHSIWYIIIKVTVIIYIIIKYINIYL